MLCESPTGAVEVDAVAVEAVEAGAEDDDEEEPEVEVATLPVPTSTTLFTGAVFTYEAKTLLEVFLPPATVTRLVVTITPA
jgi:hypothetical protein